MNSSGLQLNIEMNAAPIIFATGELDYTNCGALGDAISDALTDGHMCLKLALGELQFVDSSGLRTLLVAANNARKVGKSIVILSISPQLSRMLQISGFEQMFVMSSQTQDARISSVMQISDGTLEFDSPASIDSCREIRNRVDEFAAKAGFGPTALDDIKLAVGEAASNAIRHGTCSGDVIKVSCDIKTDVLTIGITYSSAEFNPRAIPLPDSESCANGGMGIHFMRLVMDDVYYAFNDGYTTVTMEKRIWK